MSLGDMLALAREITVAQLIERDDFSKRYRGNVPIALVEFLYPLIQGYDSVMLEADVELGGNDQLFNMLVGRSMQKNRGMEEQAVLCMPLLVGLDGTRKMSKSYGNYVAFNDSAREMFGKLMSLPDSAMGDYHRLLLGWSDAEVSAMEKLHPMEAKKQLAATLVEKFHGKEVAAQERQQFEAVFSRGEIPENMPTIGLDRFADPIDLAELLVSERAVASKNEVRRLIEQGAIRLNGQPVANPGKITREAAAGAVLQVGRRQFFRLV
jgi:tyrosyl-tRNA synthetase